ncbi:hypothetical protein ABIC83_002770 [Roseateles asaccharophilus]|uniref:hypothetical protein n=1 Tax=Roseateles asaccharophilus TaxID=582607 RepID=UPI00383688B7
MRDIGIRLLANVRDGAQVLVEIGHHSRGVAPVWTGPFVDELYLAHHGGVPVTVALRNNDIGEFDPRSSAEGSPGDVEFHGEDTILRILEIDGVKVAEYAQSAARLEKLNAEVAAVATAGTVMRMRR